MFHVVLYEPEIPPNTGNIIRLCANTGCQLHLIEPLGFKLEDKQLRRAGLDYREWAATIVHSELDHFLKQVSPKQLYTVSTHNKQVYSQVSYQSGDAILFGPETRGLPVAVRDSVAPEYRITIPMMPNNRSLNLSNAVSAVVFEAWRQNEYLGAVFNPG